MTSATRLLALAPAQAKVSVAAKATLVNQERRIRSWLFTVMQNLLGGPLGTGGRIPKDYRRRGSNQWKHIKHFNYDLHTGTAVNRGKGHGRVLYLRPPVSHWIYPPNVMRIMFLVAPG